jgi:hypothetical protein
MSQLPPRHKRRREILVIVLVAAGYALAMVTAFLNIWPLPFRVPYVLVLLPTAAGLALLTVALVLIFRDRPRVPRS